MRVAMLTREFPPEIYGGAGVHVEYLVRYLRRIVEVEVHCFGGRRSGATAYEPQAALAATNAALATVEVDVRMAAAVGEGDVLHSHTWYANLAGHLNALLTDRPHVITAHSLEPMRPWKAEQLGGGYRISSWVERACYAQAAAIIAVSEGMREDVLTYYPQVDPERVHVISNGIDTDLYQPVDEPHTLDELGVNPDRPYVLFVGRITRQKGVTHLLRAARELDPGAGLVLCAGAADTPELQEEIAAGVEQLRASRSGVVWIADMLQRRQIIALLSAASVFVCPSIYEPQGIVNLEAMACSTPVVAGRVGGIPEVVHDGEHGLLVDYDGNAPERFEAGLAAAMNALLGDPDRARRLGAAGRARALQHYGWDRIAARTTRLYETLLGGDGT